MMIDQNTSRSDLLSAIYSDGALIDHFIAADLDPEMMATQDVLAQVQAWIEAGDECAAA
jgi:hypothetical protein